MDAKDRDAAFERIGNLVLLSLETVAEHFAAVVAGEKRLAVVPRKVPGRKANGGLIYELRMVTPQPPKPLRVESSLPEAAAKAFDPGELADLAESIGTTPAPDIPEDDPEFDSDVGDTCCAGGPWWGHDDNCPLAVDPALDHPEPPPPGPVDADADRLAHQTFDKSPWETNRAKPRRSEHEERGWKPK